MERAGLSRVDSAAGRILNRWSRAAPSQLGTWQSVKYVLESLLQVNYSIPENLKWFSLLGFKRRHPLYVSTNTSTDVISPQPNPEIPSCFEPAQEHSSGLPLILLLTASFFLLPLLYYALKRWTATAILESIARRVRVKHQANKHDSDKRNQWYHNKGWHEPKHGRSAQELVCRVYTGATTAQRTRTSAEQDNWQKKSRIQRKNTTFNKTFEFDPVAGKKKPQNFYV